MSTTPLTPGTQGHIDHGHTVLAVPVPELERFVRERTAHYDTDYLAQDPDFGQAHVTVLGPWIAQPSPQDLAAIAQIAAASAPFDVRLARIDTFPNGIIHLVAEPPEPFRALPQAVWERFPSHPPYEGKFAGVTPHLTLDALGPGVDEQWVRDLLGEQIPLDARADLLQLQWWQARRCHVQHSWRLGTATGGAA